MNTDKMKWAALGIAALLALTAAKAFALDNDSFTLTFTVGNVLTVNIEDGNQNPLTDHDFSNLNFGDITVNQTTIRIDNESGDGSSGILQTYDLSVANADGIMALVEDTTALASNDYRVSAICKDAKAVSGDFDIEDILTTTAQTAQAPGAGSIFSADSGTTAEDCLASDDDNRMTGLPDGTDGEQNLWVRLELGPGTVTGQRTFATVYVTAK